MAEGGGRSLGVRTLDIERLEFVDMRRPPENGIPWSGGVLVGDTNDSQVANLRGPRLGMVQRIVFTEMPVTAHSDASFSEEGMVDHLHIWGSDKDVMLREFTAYKTFERTNHAFARHDAIRDSDNGHNMTMGTYNTRSRFNLNPRG